MLPEHLRNATPEEIFAFRQKNSRKASFTAEECRQLFRQRMVRDKRDEELDSLIAKYRDEGKSKRQAVYAAMNDLGYAGPANERKLYKRAIAVAMQDKRRETQSKCVKRYKLRMKNKDLDEVMDTLPPNASPEKEMDWVVGHRKLFHAAMQLSDESAEPVRLAAADLKDAPSQAAVTLLTIALLDPQEWAKKKRDAHKAKTEAGVGGENDKGVIPDDLSALKRIHEQFLNQKRAASG